MKKIFTLIILSIGMAAVFYFFAGSKNSIFRDEKDDTTPFLHFMKIESNSFPHNSNIPSRFTCDGADTSPHFALSGVPKNAKSLVLVSDDPDAPGRTWVHWLVWNIDPATTEIQEGTTPQEAVEGTTSFGKTGYGGPCPHSGIHRYFFKLYALDTVLDLDSNADKTKLEEAIEKHTIDSAEIIGLYESHT